MTAQCDCMSVIDGKFAEAGKNTRLQRTYTIGSSVCMFPVIGTEKADKTVRVKPLAVIPTYCPFCGLSYKTGQPAQIELTDAEVKAMEAEQANVRG